MSAQDAAQFHFVYKTFYKEKILFERLYGLQVLVSLQLVRKIAVLSLGSGTRQVITFKLIYLSSKNVSLYKNRLCSLKNVVYRFRALYIYIFFYFWQVCILLLCPSKSYEHDVTIFITGPVLGNYNHDFCWLW